MQQRERAALLDAALRLAGDRHPVLPLHTPTDSDGGSSYGRGFARPGRHPRGGFGLRHATTEPEVVIAWWSRWRSAKLCLRTDGLEDHRPERLATCRGLPAVDLVVRTTGERAGLERSAHVLRHTCVTNLVRSGNNLGAGAPASA